MASKSRSMSLRADADECALTRRMTRRSNIKNSNKMLRNVMKAGMTVLLSRATIFCQQLDLYYVQHKELLMPRDLFLPLQHHCNRLAL